MTLEIKGFIPNSMLDWEGMLVATVFLPRCNFRCPFCQNPDLVLHPERLETVSANAFLGFLDDREGWTEGVCVTGGEPCLHDDLPEFCRRIRELGLGVKLDTNGSMPDALAALLEEGLLDYVAMDVKAPLEAVKYRLASGCEVPDVVEKVTESIEILKRSGVGHEFRTTVVPIMHGPGDVEAIARSLGPEEVYVLQHFNPRDTLDPRYAELRPFTDDDMSGMLAAAQPHVARVVVRGAPAGLES